MSDLRESRHVHVTGIPVKWSDQQVVDHFGGRIQRVDRITPSSCVVSFFEVRTAKRHLEQPKMHPDFVIKFWDPTTSTTTATNTTTSVTTSAGNNYSSYSNNGGGSNSATASAITINPNAAGWSQKK
uniref:RRM domain-containing protein n=1 Tax=Panagrolaimus sp. PS1159 TaxID=55785 RepID=A0AC35G220_9BILA